MKYRLFFLSIAALGLMPQVAQASHYVTSNRSTDISFQELNGSIGTGFYNTIIGGKQWRGNFQATTVTLNSNGTTKTYSGPFNDFRTGPGPTQTCQGTISLQRPVSNPGPATIKVTWTITGGSGCPSPITSITNPPSTLTLKEPLPVANSSGNFQASNSNTLITETAGFATWPNWIVTDTTGLNCRANSATNPTGPGPIVVKNLPYGSIVDVRYLGLDSFVISGGASWMRARVVVAGSNKPCFIRANTQYVKPQPMPF
jgi:hypothetical protein